MKPIIRVLALAALVASSPAHAGNFTVTNCTQHRIGEFDIKVYNSTDLVRISPFQTKALAPFGQTAYLNCPSPDCTFTISVPRNAPQADPLGGASVMFSLSASDGTSTQTFTTSISNKATPRAAFCITRKYDKDGVLMGTYDSMIGNQCRC